MPISSRPGQPLERPSALQLAIREWQRQLVEVAERRLNPPPDRGSTAMQASVP